MSDELNGEVGEAEEDEAADGPLPLCAVLIVVPAHGEMVDIRNPPMKTQRAATSMDLRMIATEILHATQTRMIVQTMAQVQQAQAGGVALNREMRRRLGGIN